MTPMNMNYGELEHEPRSYKSKLYPYDRHMILNYIDKLLVRQLRVIVCNKEYALHALLSRILN